MFNYGGDFFVNCVDFISMMVQFVVWVVLKCGEWVDNIVDCQFVLYFCVDIVMSGDIGQYFLQDIGEIIVIVVLFVCWVNMCSIVSDMNNDIIVVVCSMGDSFY